MDAGTHSLRVIFGQDRRHVVPLYQRPYVWSQQVQWAPLWDDLRSIADRTLANQPMRPHFMGAIVLDQADVPYGTIDTRWVIDGQQRLTTMQIVLEAFGDCCKAQGLDPHERAAKRLTRNDDPLSTEEDHVFKIWPTNTDQEHFRRVMRAGTPGQVLSEYGMPSATWVGHPIADAYLFFFRNIESWLKEDQGRKKERADAMFGALKDAIRLVVIDLKDGDDAQLIFETLNARGTPLLPSDLIKNFLFITAADQGLDREKLYRKHWQHFDTDASYWRQLLGRGFAQRARLDIFIQHYLTLRMRDEVPVAHLYSAFKSFCAMQPTASVEERFKDLARYSAIYRTFDTYPATTREGRFFRRLAAMDISTAYPWLLELFARFPSGSPMLVESLDILESFLVRRMICALNTRAYNRLFTDLLSVFEEPDETIRDRLTSDLASGKADSNIWPSDEEVRQALAEKPIYKTLVRERVSMLLQALNSAMHDAKTEQVLLESLTIEHLMPQSWTGHWAPPAPDDETTRAERNRLIHTLGNLTLLTKKLNPSISNGNWEHKRKEILNYTALNLNRSLPAEWSDSSIKTRTAELATLSCKVWDAPASVRSAGLRIITTKNTDLEPNNELTTYPTDEVPKPPSQRQQILQRFWATLLERAKGKAPLLANRSATTDCWLSASAGRAGFWYNLTITQEIARIECYMRVKNGQDVHNKAIFHTLMEQRSSIEAAFGGPLDWQELPGRIGCRICTTIPGSWQLPEYEWPTLQDEMVKLLVRLERALREPIQELDVESFLTAEPA